MLTYETLINILANQLGVSKYFVEYINDFDLLIIMTDFLRKSKFDTEDINIILDLEEHFDIELNAFPSNLEDFVNYINNRK